MFRDLHYFMTILYKFRAINWGSLPALSAPVTVRRDDHLPAVVCVSVVNVQLQLLTVVVFDERKQVLTLV